MQRQNKTMVLRVSLLEIKPEIWRQVEVPATYSFWDLHVAVQDAMGWLDYHLHVFRVPDPETGETQEIGISDDDRVLDSPPVSPGWETAIANYFIEPGDQAFYDYDFGENWEHQITLDRIADRKKGAKYPKCLNGERPCPPEDCGGVWGYEHLLEVISDPEHDEYETMIEWPGGQFDPELFDADSVSFDSPKGRWKHAFAEE